MLSFLKIKEWNRLKYKHFHYASAELAHQIADSQVGKSTYHTQHKLFTCNHANGKENAVILMRSITIAGIVGKRFYGNYRQITSEVGQIITAVTSCILKFLQQ